MTVPALAWPLAAFPYQPLNEGFKETLPDAQLRSDFDQGLARQRTVYRNAPTTFDGNWVFTPAQYKLFKGFLGVARGSFFQAPIFIDDDYVTVTARFVKGSVSAVRQGGEWIVTAQIETMDKVSMSEDEYVEAIAIYGSDETIDTFIADFHEAVNYGFLGMA